MPLSSSSFTFTFCVILNLILCQIPRMDTIDAGMPIFCQAFCSDRRNIDIEDILTWPRLKQRRFTARDIPEMVTYQLRNSSGNIAALSRKPHHNTNTASQPKQQFGLRGIGRLFPIIFFQSSIYICVFVLACLVSKFSIGHFCKYRSALLYSYLHPSSFSSFIPFESFSEFSIALICCFDDTLHFIYCVHIVCNQSWFKHNHNKAHDSSNCFQKHLENWQNVWIFIINGVKNFGGLGWFFLFVLGFVFVFIIHEVQNSCLSGWFFVFVFVFVFVSRGKLGIWLKIVGFCCRLTA